MKNTRRKSEGGRRRISAQRLTSRASSRRGVLLLVILGMLTLFLMIGTAFISSSNQYRRANKSYSKVGEQKNLAASQEGFLGEVINQLIRDTGNQNSALRYHSLLRDMYGSEGIVATIGNVQWAGSVNATYPRGETNGQMIQFQITAAQDMLGNPIPLPNLSTIDNAYSGQVVTFISDPTASSVSAKGRSTRVLGYVRTGPNDTDPFVFRVLSMPLANGSQITDPTLLIGSRILINGRPFNGTGVGYNSLAAAGLAKLDAAETVVTPSGNLNVPIALAPNAAFFVPVPGTNVSDTYFSSTWATLNATQRAALLNSMGYEGQGGSDETYDAPDFQNMFLAWTAPNVVDTIFPNLDSTPNPADPSTPFDRTNLPPYLGGIVLPSFHRPELINYWANQTASTPGDLTTATLGLTGGVPLLRKILLRPNWHDHPDFDGSNPEYAAVPNGSDKILRMIYGPWDVDNDNDGVRDSIWVDFGAPVMVGSKGRLVKPLAAIMVLDMDGRLNVNAHGTIDIQQQGTNIDVPLAGTSSRNAPKGLSFGTAEISLRPVLNVDQVAAAETFRRLLGGDTIFGAYFPGRYGTTTSGNYYSSPGVPAMFDLPAQLKMQGFPRRHDQTARSNFGSLPDLKARYGLGLNDFGQAIHEADYETSPRASLDEGNPYELDISSTGARGAGSSVDNPFSLAELERLLRAFDLDAGTLSPRLFELLKGSQSTANPDELRNWRTLLTTDSYDLPEPGVQLPAWVRNGIPGVANSDFFTVMGRQPVNASYADLIEYRVRAAQSPIWTVATDAANPTRLRNLRRAMALLVAPEMMAGLKLDLNRPLGNGRDENNNGVVDEPGEYFDANGNGMLDAGEDEGALWLIDYTRAGVASSTASASFEDATTAIYRDEFDRNGNGIIEDFEWGDTLPDNNSNGVIDDVDGDGQLTQVELVNLHNFRRQLLARHLYVLAMAVVDPLPIPAAGPSDPTYLEKYRARTRQLAQWAINAADFRDPDNIMTAFEYDQDPFRRGWLLDINAVNPAPIDGVANSTYNTADNVQLVWGSEKPELLITETLAWHDRGVTDESGENADLDEQDSGEEAQVSTGSREPDQKWDRSYDQRYRPQGATFVELYNPWAATPAASADTHAVEGFNWDENPDPSFDGSDLGINLSAVSQVPRTTGGTDFSPVWRLANYQNRFLTKLGTNEVLPGPDKNPDALDRRVVPTTLDRTVYFTGQDPMYTHDGASFFNDLAQNPVRSVRPGRYMVVGAGERTNEGKYLARMGIRKNAPFFDSTARGIVLDPDPASPHAVGLHATAGTDDSLNMSDPTSFVLDTDAQFRVVSPSETSVSGFLPPVRGSMRSSIADVAIVDQPRRFSISEPARGYPRDYNGSRWDGMQYGPKFIDIPLDDQRSYAASGGGGGIGGGGNRGGGIGMQPDRKKDYADGETRLQLPGFGTAGGGLGGGGRDPKPGGGIGGSGTGNDPRTVPAFSWIYLQRLANPLLPWNPPANNLDGTPNLEHRSGLAVNPYLTVDSMGTNVTVFNGLKPEEEIRLAATERPIRFNNNFAIALFSSMQRGRINNPFIPARYLSEFVQNPGTPVDFEMLRNDPKNSNLLQKDLWTTEAIGKVKTPSMELVAGYWKNKAGAGTGAETGQSGHNFNGIPDMTLGFLNDSYRALNPSNDVRDRVVPEVPFPSIDWYNRPFANPAELMKVHGRSGLQLLNSFSFINTSATLPGIPKEEVYDGRVPKIDVSDEPDLPKLEIDGPYGHLLNFFRSKMHAGTDTNPGTIDDEGIAGLHRVLDFVAVPSLYVGSETWLNPQAFGSTAVANTTDPRYGLQPPFNRVSSRREPGRVNLNTTMFGDSAKGVWDGVMHGSAKRAGNNDLSHPGPDEDGLISIRRGYGILNDGASLLNAAYPTLVGNPFRPTNTGDLVPLANMIREGTEATLMRSMGNKPPTGFTGTESIPQTQAEGVPFLTTDTDEAYRDAERNPYFRYSPISRLSSMTTTRSNVFAVWVTIGFFEVEEINETDHRSILARFGPMKNGTLADAQQDPLFQRVYPDGYLFGKEAGIETGENERVREFAIIDRTIPVAFEPGANHNSQETIRLRRKIE